MRWQRGWRSLAAAPASRSARAPVLPSRGTILSATSRPVCSSRASQTEPELPPPSGRIGRYRASMSSLEERATDARCICSIALDMHAQCPLRAGRRVTVIRAERAQTAMTERDDDLDFEFFDDEPATQEAVSAQPRIIRRVPRPPTPPRPPAGITPLLRLVGLIALAI